MCLGMARRRDSQVKQPQTSGVRTMAQVYRITIYQHPPTGHQLNPLGPKGDLLEGAGIETI